MLNLSIAKSTVTRQDIIAFIQKLQVHLPLLKDISKANNIVYCADISKADNRLLIATVSVFESKEATTEDIVKGNYVKVVSQWMDKKRLWFKLVNGKPEPYIDYVDQYRDIFSVDLNKPQLIFNIHV